MMKLNDPVKIDKNKVRAEYSELIEQLLDDEIDAKAKFDVVAKLNFLSENTLAKYMLNSDYVECRDLREED
jgi:hypothetical protein